MGILVQKFKEYFEKEETKPLFIIFVEVVSIFTFLFSAASPKTNLMSILSPIPFAIFNQNQKSQGNEIFGFAPHWKINALDNVDFSTLTTLAYFDVSLDGDGTIDRYSTSYEVLKSEKAKKLFAKAHRHGTKVVLTITQMENDPIEALLDSDEAQKTAISEIVKEVKEEKLDGVNVDMEYVGLPADGYRNKFTRFVADLTSKLHKEIPNTYVTVSVYAASAMEKKTLRHKGIK